MENDLIGKLMHGVNEGYNMFVSEMSIAQNYIFRWKPLSEDMYPPTLKDDGILVKTENEDDNTPGWSFWLPKNVMGVLIRDGIIVQTFMNDESMWVTIDTSNYFVRKVGILKFFNRMNIAELRQEQSQK